MSAWGAGLLGFAAGFLICHLLWAVATYRGL